MRKPRSPDKKKQTRGQESEDPMLVMVKDMEAKLKAISKDRAEQTRAQLRELDAIAPLDCDDFTKNHDILKKLRAIKWCVVGLWGFALGRALSGDFINALNDLLVAAVGTFVSMVWFRPRPGRGP